MKITIIKEDAEKALDYRDTDNCLLATALKRILPDAKFSCYFSLIFIEGKETLQISYENAQQIQHSYKKDWSKVDLRKFKPMTFVTKKY